MTKIDFPPWMSWNDCTLVQRPSPKWPYFICEKTSPKMLLAHWASDGENSLALGYWTELSLHAEPTAGYTQLLLMQLCSGNLQNCNFVSVIGNVHDSQSYFQLICPARS